VLAIDHVVVLVPDLDGAAAWMWEVHGLASVAGGRHPGHGTGNRIVPLGATYVELMAVIDPQEAASSPMGRWAAAHTLAGPSPAALCLRTDDADREGARLGLSPVPMARTRPDGSTLSWRLVGMDDAFGDDRLPFFIQWHGDPADHPGRMAVDHRVDPTGGVRVALGGAPDVLRHRIGDDDLPIEAVGGTPGITRVVIETVTGEIAL
jgi:hypothetical protein